MVKAPHCVELAWKLLFSTWRYRVLTVCDRSRLNSATLVPEAIHTAQKDDQTYKYYKDDQTYKYYKDDQTYKYYKDDQTYKYYKDDQTYRYYKDDQTYKY